MRSLRIVLIAVAVITILIPGAHAVDGPLAGSVIAIDPGHQLGNSNPKFAAKMKQTRFNGSIVKSCNTTGTATNAGLPEATFTWKVANWLKSLLEAQGAQVHLTREVNSRNAWGPCVWDRGGFGEKVNADLMVSLHGDGAPAKGRGFHVIAPVSIKGWSNDIAKPSRVLANALITGMKQAGGTPTTYLLSPLSVRRDQSTLNFSNVPAVIVELGNMRNKQDAQKMSSTSGQLQYARELVAGISRYCAVQVRCH